MGFKDHIRKTLGRFVTATVEAENTFGLRDHIRKSLRRFQTASEEAWNILSFKEHISKSLARFVSATAEAWLVSPCLPRHSDIHSQDVKCSVSGKCSPRLVALWSSTFSPSLALGVVRTLQLLQRHQKEDHHRGRSNHNFFFVICWNCIFTS